ncbi:AsnC family transcriptional regulator [Paenibacillus chitinolyticus]|uniref:Lrp/AsnC family transcriptional regulator n=1 Tax=Paenibacillus chitinolyticus TaxID=79263 RepID=UPI0026E4AF44|nr:Lrp/AsnC family transcriptional regulator [Paenibacillus chitinolyticus]GKS12418.1 AsnC family transcriptional regulator [Paenibacillus chitinolyticus]
MDYIDTNILYHLQHQARISMTELGKCVGLSQPAVTERVKRMEEKGIIEQYRTIVSPEKIGKHVAAFVPFHTRDCDGFIDFCHSSPEVIECHRISGEYNYMLKVVTDSIQSLEKFVKKCDKYGSYTIVIVMSSPIDHKFFISEGESSLADQN